MAVRSARAHASLCGAASVLPQGVSRAPLRIRGGRVAASVPAWAYRVDLRDHLIFPGLVNAHEHLQVNAVPPLATTAVFPNSYAWIEAFQQHFGEPAVIEALLVPKAVRLRHGGLKNLLAGTTCVAHHDPWHTALDDADFPVALLRDYGWSYALDWTSYGPPVQQSFAQTPVDWPWLIHLAEGTDAAAQGELARLDELGCLAPRSVLVHGVGLREADIDRIIAVGAGVVWCPTSNERLLGRTLRPGRLADAGHLALGTDSRLSGSRDLLEELRRVAAGDELPPQQWLGLVTDDAARLLRLPRHGHLQVGAHADLVIVADRGGDPLRSLVGIERRQLRAVVRDGLPRIADPDFADWFEAAGVEAVPVTLDGRPKLLAKALAEPAVIALEPGLVLSDARDTRAVQAFISLEACR
ncbi:amidohydrolase family protein [Dyella japonica]|uniref:Amidohydrolase n=1 Tax=Dyella japonica A8 TaxID=1217721 RepID=A0A075JYE0_9GAMM|nr:amidohydrolase family protein [Dyella japonica]AIF46964.1 amidohydrolase [Dyella japonica A8]